MNAVGETLTLLAILGNADFLLSEAEQDRKGYSRTCSAIASGDGG